MIPPPPARPRFARLLLLAGLALLASGCGGCGDSESTAAKGPGHDGRVKVIVDKSLELHPDCQPMTSCVRYYLEYFRKAVAEARPITEEELERQLDSISGENRSVAEGDPEADELRHGLVSAMNLHALLGGLEKRELKVRELKTEKLGSLTQTTLLLEDPMVGLFRALLLLPPGQGPFAGIVAHPGHSESAELHRDQRYGRALAERGYAVFIIDPRANDGGHHETRVAREALLQGHSIMGLRVYEILLAQKYLRWDGRVDGERLGLQGHSGGSVAGNLVVRIDGGFSAYVSDLFSTYGIVLDRDRGFLGDETSSAIYFWHASIEDLTTSRVPMLQEPYAYKDGPEGMFDFFDQQLARRGLLGR